MIQIGGAFLVRSHEALAAAIVWLLPQVVAWTAGPAVAWFVVTAVAGSAQVAAGPDKARDYVSDVVTSLALLGVCLSLPVFMDFVYGGIFNTLPAWITELLVSFGATLGLQVGGPQSMGAALNGLHAQAWTLIAETKARAGMNMSVGVTSDLVGIGTSVLIAIMIYTYGLAEWLLALLVAAAAPVFALGQWRRMRDVIWRWAGYVVSVSFLFFLGVAALVIAVHVLTGMFAEFVARQEQAEAAINAMPLLNIPGRLQAVNAAMAQDIQMLCEMIAMLFLAVLTLFAVPGVAYSLGTGVVGGHGLAAGAALYAARDLIAGGISALARAGGPGGSGGGGGRGSPNYDLSMPDKSQGQIGAAGNRIGSPTRALPPPALPVPRD